MNVGIIGRPDSPIAQATTEALKGVSLGTIYRDAFTLFPTKLAGLVHVANLDSYPDVFDVPYDEIDRCLLLAVHSLIDAIRTAELIPGAGIVVLNSAFVGRKHTGRGIAYSIAKAAQRQVILNASISLKARNNFIVGIAPAFIDTKPTKRMNTDPEYRAEILKQLSVTEFGTAAEVGRFVRHLLVDGRYMNGATLDMSGGWSY